MADLSPGIGPKVGADDFCPFTNVAYCLATVSCRLTMSEREAVSTIARPMPEEDPVMIATLWSNRPAAWVCTGARADMLGP